MHFPYSPGNTKFKIFKKNTFNDLYEACISDAIFKQNTSNIICIHES